MHTLTWVEVGSVRVAAGRRLTWGGDGGTWGRGVDVVDVWLVVGGGVGRRGVGGFGGSDVAGEVVVRRL